MKVAASFLLFLIAAAMFSTAMAISISLAHAGVCISKEKNKLDFVNDYPTAIITDLPLAQAQGFLKNVMAAHPDEAHRAVGVDEGQVFQVPGLDRVVVTIFKGGCILFNMSFTPESFQNYMTGDEGTPT